jgi:hypothetical protein
MICEMICKDDKDFKTLNWIQHTSFCLFHLTLLKKEKMQQQRRCGSFKVIDSLLHKIDLPLNLSKTKAKMRIIEKPTK